MFAGMIWVVSRGREKQEKYKKIRGKKWKDSGKDSYSIGETQKRISAD